MKVESFEQLEVWQKAHAMALDVYKLTSQLPEEEEFGLILRMRKSACDVPSNIANGFERRQMVAKLALYREARAAVEELRYYFILCRDLGYPIDFDKFNQGGDQLARMVGGLVGSIARVENERMGRGRGPRRGDNRDRGPRRYRDQGGEQRGDQGGEHSDAPTSEQSGDDVAGGPERGEVTE